MILQTGQRTDIPAFYSEWFVNRVKEGYVLVRNPYNPQSVTRYNINPDVVDLIAFCTKNPLPMLDKMDILNPYGQYWFVTITPYGRDIEPVVPEKMRVREGVWAGVMIRFLFRRNTAQTDIYMSLRLWQRSFRDTPEPV